MKGFVHIVFLFSHRLLWLFWILVCCIILYIQHGYSLTIALVLELLDLMIRVSVK